jgi:RNA-binding protein YlmH
MEIYQHFRKEEHAFIDLVMEWAESVNIHYSPKLTDFLDPREQQILKNVVGLNPDVLYKFCGGSEFVERKRALLYPNYYEPSEDDFQLTLFHIEYPNKYVSIDHPQVLGSLMAMGLKRSKFGDILKEYDTIQVIVASEVAPFIELNLLSIGKAKVSLKPLPLNSMINVIEHWNEETCTVSSLRLDVIISQAFNLSRTKSVPFIEGGRTKVNWRQVEEPAFECREGDIISVRGHGRIKILNIEGKTKREKWRIHLGKK